MQTGVAIGLDLPSADDDSRLIFADHETVRGRDGGWAYRRRRRGDRRRNDVPYRRRDMHPENGAMESPDRSLPVSAMGRAMTMEGPAEDPVAGHDRRWMVVAMVDMARMMAVTLSGLGGGRRACHENRRERGQACRPGERFQAAPSALFIPHAEPLCPCGDNRNSCPPSASGARDRAPVYISRATEEVSVGCSPARPLDENRRRLQSRKRLGDGRNREWHSKSDRARLTSKW